MNPVKLKEADVATYSRLISLQFVDFARKEVISNNEASERFLSCYHELYGPPRNSEALKGILMGKVLLSSDICIAAVKEYMHCPVIGVFKTLIAGSLNLELVEASNKIIARALIS